VQNITLTDFDIFDFGCKFALAIAKVAQLVERNLAKVEVASSRLVFRSKPFQA
jgi:hypothetical protein